MNKILITGDMLIRYNELTKKKKEIENEMNTLKEIFHTYFDMQIGENKKGELIDNGIKLQRQIRKTEKYQDEKTVEKLEGLNMNDLIKIVKKPDEEKINAAINLGFLNEDELKECLITSYSKAISVKEL